MDPLPAEIPFRDPARALETFPSVSLQIPPEMRPGLRALLAAAADPDAALHYLERLRKEQPEAFRRLLATPMGVQPLVAVFSSSRFLSEAILKRPEWIEDLLASGDLHRLLSAEEFERRLEAHLAAEQAGMPSPLSLATFRRRQLLRIVLRDLLGLGSVSDATGEISNLADAILEVTYRRIRGEMVRRYGTPRYETSGGMRECGFSVLALGKLGGQELNYSSDIDLMYIYSGNGETSGPNRISNKEFFKKVATSHIELLSTYTPEGMCYRVDLRLRPEGRLGEVCISLDGARNYYRSRARDWELQMLIKARCAAGDRHLTRELLDFVEPLIYSTTLDFTAVESMSATRDRMSEKLARRRKASTDLDIKLARGGIRDIEFLVQCLQRLHGGREPWVRHGGTWFALFRLRDKGLLSGGEYSRLTSAYDFLRTLEHRLQFLDDRQTHALPQGREELEALARKMPPGQAGSVPSGEALLRELNRHLEEVQEIYERVIHAQRPSYYTATPANVEGDVPLVEPAAVVEPAASNLVRSLDERAPGVAAALSAANLQRGRLHFEHFLERILQHGEYLAWLNSDRVLAARTLDLFEHSPYFAEELIRNPEFIEELRDMKPGSAPRPYGALALAIENAADLRRFFRREMFRLQAESICLRAPIFETLARTSELADQVIASAYRMAVRQTLESRPPSAAGYAARNQLMVVTLGRLGMREFDLASDADLIFILPDEDSAELMFWTRVAERMIDLITAYTGQGVMFAVDTRLRPNGREGALVQLESRYKDYFAQHAEAWEGITYMKSRAVAGDLDRATEFLHALQEVDWRRYGQSGRSVKQLGEMRLKLEKEQGAENPLKAARGGYYDIDFTLMYLRLRGAGIFYKVLNTPARIDVIEQMGHLDREDAEFLRDAATFYRAVDHGLRVFSGHAEGTLPHAHAQLEALTELVRRWTPAHLHDQPLPVELAQIRFRTRQYFERIFGTSIIKEV